MTERAERARAEVRGRNLLICLDGTGNKPESQSISNVVRIAMAAKMSTAEGREQLVHYQRGVGSSYKLDGFLGGASGAGIRASVISAYTFLVCNYRAGDRIFVFGFSRGAFVARLLSGLVDYSGIVRTDEFAAFRAAISRYFGKSDFTKDSAEMREFRYENCHPDKSIQYIGLFDAVGGWLAPKWLSGAPHGYRDDCLGDSIHYGRHALSIDERRIAFAPTFWSRPDKPVQNQSVKQVWFPGVHSDIGGASPALALGDDALDWIVAGAKNEGAEFNEKLFPEPRRVLEETQVRRWFRTGYDPGAEVRFFLTQLGWTVFGVVMRPYALFRNWRVALRISRPLREPDAEGLRVSSTAVALMQDPLNKYRPRNLRKLFDANGKCALEIEELPSAVAPAEEKVLVAK